MTSYKKRKGIDFKPYLIAILIPFVLFTIYIGYRIYSTDRILIPISVFALLGGLFYEYSRLSDYSSTFWVTALIAFILSFFAFLPFGDDANYFLNNHIERWPYVFCVFFILFAILVSGNKAVPKLTEGITLMQSITIIYWIIDVSPLAYNFIIFLKLLGLAFAIYSIYFAFNSTKISRTNRLYLSVWSSLIMLVFSIDNIYQLYHNPPIENIDNPAKAVFIASQFFLLGVSSIYIVQNYFLLDEFIPMKRKFFNKEYFLELKKLKKQHIDRYSTEHMNKVQWFFCLLITGAVYGFNYHFNFLPRNFVIWSVFVLFPLLVKIIERPSKPISTGEQQRDR